MTAQVAPVLLITGASSGSAPRPHASRGHEGWRVVLAARSAESLEALAGELGGPEHALAVPCDVTDWDEQQRMVAERAGRLRSGSTRRSRTPASGAPAAS